MIQFEGECTLSISFGSIMCELNRKKLVNLAILKQFHQATTTITYSYFSMYCFCSTVWSGMLQTKVLLFRLFVFCFFFSLLSVVYPTARNTTPGLVCANVFAPSYHTVVCAEYNEINWNPWINVCVSKCSVFRRVATCTQSTQLCTHCHQKGTF